MKTAIILIACLATGLAIASGKDDARIKQIVKQLTDLKAPGEYSEVYRLLFATAGADGLSRLQADRDDSIALQSAWISEHWERTRPRDRIDAVSADEDAESLGQVVRSPAETSTMHGPVAIILAAGQGKRMKSEKAKVLHEVCGQPMIRYVVDAARGAGAKTIVVVVGYAADQIRDYLEGEPDILFATQTEQLGTGHAVKICRELLADYQGPALVLVGDEPLLRPEPLADLLERQRIDQAACLLGTAVMLDPMGFGRILRDSAGRFLRIVEERDCTPEERALTEVNPSCYVFELPGLWSALDQIGTSNAQGEYYLTDAPEQLKSMGMKVLALNVLRADDVLGVNTRQHLAQAGAVMQSRIQDHWMTEGVSIVDPRNTFIDGRASIGRDTVIYPFTVITGSVKIGSSCRVGPFSHVRDGTILDDGVDMGAFVETKQSHLGRGTMVRHLAYLGDAEVGERVNIGATAITANFDGQRKNPTRIGDRSQIGAGAILVAPVTIGADAVVGANAVVTRDHDVAAGQTVAGVPARPIEKKNNDPRHG